MAKLLNKMPKEDAYERKQRELRNKRLRNQKREKQNRKYAE